MRMHRKGSVADFRLHHCGYLGAIDSWLESLKSWNEESIWINAAFDVLFSLSSKKQPESGQHFSKLLKAQRFHRVQVCSWKTETGTDGIWFNGFSTSEVCQDSISTCRVVGQVPHTWSWTLSGATVHFDSWVIRWCSLKHEFDRLHLGAKIAVSLWIRHSRPRLNSKHGR